MDALLDCCGDKKAAVEMVITKISAIESIETCLFCNGLLQTVMCCVNWLAHLGFLVLLGFLISNIDW